MRRGDHERVQRMFRARILAQGFTVAAIAAGGLYFRDERHRERELWKLQQQREAEDKRRRWVRELEVRDEEDRAVREHMQKRRRKTEDWTTKETEVDDGTASVERRGSDSDAAGGGQNSSGSSGGWFGGSLWQTSSSSTAAAPVGERDETARTVPPNK